MAAMLDSFVHVSTEYAWAVFVICSIACALGTATFCWHIYESQSRRYAWLVVLAGVAMTVGFLLGGVQAGDAPVVDKTLIIPWIRLAWLIGGSIMLVFLALYWSFRIKIVRQ